MMDELVLFYYIIYVIMYFMNLKSYILQDLFICSYDEKKNCFFILFHFILPLYDIYDLSIVRK